MSLNRSVRSLVRILTTGTGHSDSSNYTNFEMSACAWSDCAGRRRRPGQISAHGVRQDGVVWLRCQRELVYDDQRRQDTGK